MGAPTQDFGLLVFTILSFNGIKLSMIFSMACYLYRRCKCVVYGSYTPPIGNQIITSGPKLLYNFL